MAFDPNRGRLVLFGGQSMITGQWLQDTWEWDGNNWMLVATTSAPPAGRNSFAMVFDPISQRMLAIVNGGAETWAYNGSDWVFVDAHYPNMINPPFTGWATDYRHGQALVMGLWGGAFSTWAWDGQQWSDRPIDQSGPAAQMSVNAAFDWGRQRVVLFGDSASRPCWERTSSGWREVAVQGASPPARIPQGLCYSAASGNLLLVGGGGAGDIWTLTTTHLASRRHIGNPCGAASGSLEPADPQWEVPWAGGAYELLVRGTGGYSTAALGGMWAGFSDSRWGSTSLPFSVSPYGIGGCDLFLSPDGFLPLAFQSGSARWTVTLPRDPALYGVEFFNQAMLYAPGASASGFGLSTAVGSTIGNR